MTWSLRPALPADREFLTRVYASTRAAEMAWMDWPEEEQQAFLRSQFAAQALHYERFFPRHRCEVIVVEGQDAGRLIVDREGSPDLHLMDVALLPALRGRGIGTQVMRMLLAESSATARPVLLHVEFNNPALALYRRLGFVEVEDLGLHRCMRWTSPACAGAAA